jgi:hypothetical protein
MAILAAALGMVSRFFGKILTTTLGWASTLLFGRVPASRQVLLAGLTFGSVLWSVIVLGVLVPDVGTFLLAFVPDQDVVPESTLRLAMLIAALVIPAGLGALTLVIADAQRSPRTIVVAVLRGYPLTALLAGLLVFLAGLAVTRKARSLAKGWTDAHVPLVVKPGAYEEVARDLDAAVTAAGLEGEPRAAPAVMSTPARWLAAVAGTRRGGLVPDRMIQLDGQDLDILIYPMDILISGKPRLVRRARAAIASRLTTSHAHLTLAAEAQALEDRLTALARDEDGSGMPTFDDRAVAELAAIDAVISTLDIPYEEWEVLYRQRLQVERDLRAASMSEPVAERASAGAARVVKSVAIALGDPETVEALDRATGREWRVVAAVGSTVAAIIAGWLRSAARRRAPAGPDRTGPAHPG